MSLKITTAVHALLGLSMMMFSTCASANNESINWNTEAEDLRKKVDIIMIRIKRANNGSTYHEACNNLSHASLQAAHVSQVANAALDPRLKSTQPPNIRKYFFDTLQWSKTQFTDISSHIAKEC